MIPSPSPYLLRPLQLADLPGVQAIERLSLPTPSKAGTYEYELTQNTLAHYQALTVQTDDAPLLIGYSGYWLIGDEVHISIIAVRPQWRGRGLGELLLLNILFLAQAQQARAITLEVRRHNTVAQALYQKYAFAVVGERRGYYTNGDDALLMTADLTETFYQTMTAGWGRLQARLQSG